MLKITPRLNPYSKPQKNIQNTNFGKINKKQIEKAVIITAASAILFSWAGIISSYQKNKELKKELQTSLNSAKHKEICHNSDVICENKMGFPFIYNQANKYLSDVKDSLAGKKIEPFKKHHLDFLLKK